MSDSPDELPQHACIDQRQAEHGEKGTNESNDAPTASEFRSPFAFSNRKKWIMTVLLASMTTVVTFGSSVWSSTIHRVAAQFHVSETVAILGVSLYVLGFALGPIVWGPLSELTGRKLPLFLGFFMWLLLQIPIGLINNLPALLVFRMLGGCFGAAPVALVGAMYADFWEPAERGTATAVYSAAVYIGPTLGPIFGSLVTESQLGWHWIAWITMIFGGVVGLLAFITIPETYAPILQQRANKKAGLCDVSPSNGQLSVPAPDLQTFVRKYMVKPAIMICVEPMLIVMTLYISIVYGILYLTFFAFPYSFEEGRGWDPQVGSLPFLSILVSVLVSSIGVGLYSRKYYRPRLLARGSVLPEDRLPPMILGSFILPAGIFWFAWTSNSHISPVPQIISGVFIGSGIMLIFTNGVAFLVDIYLQSAASAMAANTCVRSAVAAGFPLAAPQMYKSLGIPWATSVLGFLCVLLIPAPILFYRYGRKLRQMSRYAPTPR